MIDDDFQSPETPAPRRLLGGENDSRKLLTDGTDSPGNGQGELVPVPSQAELAGLDPPAKLVIRRAGRVAEFATGEFFYGAVRNEYTRTAYQRAVNRFLTWCDERGLELVRIAPAHVGRYLDELRGEGKSIPTCKQHLAAIRHFFDMLVTRHAVILNPALSVRGERYAVVEGKTPEISVAQARQLLGSMATSSVVGLRDRAILAVLAYTSSRAGAVASLRRGDFYDAGDQWMLHFAEKRGKSREIPVRHDLQEMISAYLAAAGLEDASKDTPLFRAAMGKTDRLSAAAMHVNDICRMMKRRLADSSLPARLSLHSFRVAVITDLLEQGVPLEDVQRLAGHADPRTTRLYDRRQQKVTRNIVERISI